MVEGRAARRLHRLQPERQGPHGRLGVFGAAHPDARVSAPLAWDEVDDCDPQDFTLASMPARFARIGDRHAGIDTATAASLDALLTRSAQDEKDGLADAPWPPHFRKQPGEPTRVQPSKARAAKHPLIEIGRSRVKREALAGLKRWKARHAKAAAFLKPEDVLVDSMRGRSTTWTRIRVNLQHVPPKLRPRQAGLDPDDRRYGTSGISLGLGLEVGAKGAYARGHPETHQKNVCQPEPASRSRGPRS